jgi:hypothetical protein
VRAALTVPSVRNKLHSRHINGFIVAVLNSDKIDPAVKAETALEVMALSMQKGRAPAGMDLPRRVLNYYLESELFIHQDYDRYLRFSRDSQDSNQQAMQGKETQLFGTFKYLQDEVKQHTATAQNNLKGGLNTRQSVNNEIYSFADLSISTIASETSVA